MESASNVFDCFVGSDRAAKAIARIQNKPYDTDSWNMLLKEATNKNIEELEPFYEELLKTFPTCGRYWRTYIEHEMRSKRYDRVSKLFQRSLEEVLSTDLFKCYLNFVRETKSNQPDLIYKAFRYTLDKVGIDPNAIQIYNEYIQFIKDREVDGSYLDSQKITAVRKAYQEGVINPMFHIDTLWKEYISFEQSINPIIAENMVQNHSREHMNARRVAKEWEVTIRGLNRNWPAVPPSSSPEESKQIDIWRRYIQWEKSNPLRVDNSHVTLKRISYAYKQFLLSFGHHPNVWHEYACFLDEQAKASTNDKEIEKITKEQILLFERATKGLMKHNLLIHFSYADFEESRNDKKKTSEIYNRLADSCRDNNQIDITLVYIQWMRFTRRTEGLKAARAVFKRARDESRCGHQIYVAAALMEYNCTKDQAIACKIFELGLKKFSSCRDFILSYIYFMNSLNEENNTRVLFERVMTTCCLQPNETIEIWNSFLEFEAGIGDLSSITKVERRRIVALEKEFPKAGETSWAIDKYKFQDLYPCNLNELKSLGYHPQQASTALVSVQDLMSSLGPQGPMNSSASSTLIQQNSASSNQNHQGLKRVRHNNRSNALNGQTLAEFDQGDSEMEFPINLLNQTSNMCMPDLDQMLPFKPVMAPSYKNHPVQGGVFPPPQAVSNLLARLPQSGSFWGPFVDIDELCDIIRTSDFDKLFNKMVDQRRAEANKPRTKKARTDH